MTTNKDREDELLCLIPDEYKPILKGSIHNLVVLENDIKKLEALPHIKYTKDKSRQEILPASRQYKEKLNLYITIINQITRTIQKTSANLGEDNNDPFINALNFGDDGDDLS